MIKKFPVTIPSLSDEERVGYIYLPPSYETNTEIVSFAITGEYKLFSKNLKLKFGKPIKIKSYDLLLGKMCYNRKANVQEDRF